MGKTSYDTYVHIILYRAICYAYIFSMIILSCLQVIQLQKKLNLINFYSYIEVLPSFDIQGMHYHNNDHMVAMTCICMYVCRYLHF